MKPLIHLLLLCAAIAVLTFGISRVAHAPRPNIILISIDTLRADHLSCYGYKRPTPNIDALAEDGILFESAISQAPWTTASHMSVFTSLYPSVHRVTHNALSDVQSTLTSVFQNSGYETAAFVEATALDPRFGFKRGFDLYQKKSDDPSARANNERIFHWLQSRSSGKPFFLFAHYYDVHRKYQPPSPYDKIYAPHEIDVDYLITGPYGRRRSITFQQIYDIVALYDGEIRYVDDQIKNLVQFLKDHRLYQNSMIVLMADHGEGFLDHSLLDHGNSLYQELIHVPLIIKLPGNRNSGSRRSQTVRLIDVLPTVLDYTGLKANGLMQGNSIMPALYGDSRAANSAYATEAEGSDMIFSGGWKLIHNANLQRRMELVPLALPVEWELYNLNVDPQEFNNIADSSADKRQELGNLLLGQTTLNEKLAGRIHTEHRPLDQDTVDELKALGYIQ